MRCLFVAVVLFMAVQQPSASQQQKPKQETQQGQKRPDAQNRASPISVQISQTAAAPEKADATNEEKQGLCSRLLEALIENWPLAVIGILALWLTWRTLETLEKQANAAKDAASAALLNAQTVIASERPWLLVPPNGIEQPYLVPVEENMGKRATSCVFRIKNYGDTPARIFASKVESCNLGIRPMLLQTRPSIA